MYQERTLARVDRSETANDWLCRVPLADMPALWRPEQLADLSRHVEWTIRWAVASHPQVPVETLKRLAMDPEACVRAAVAAHPQTSPLLLRVLAEDPDLSVRRTVALHPQTPEVALAALCDDDEIEVLLALCLRQPLVGPCAALLEDRHDPRLRRLVQRLLTPLRLAWQR